MATPSFRWRQLGLAGVFLLATAGCATRPQAGDPCHTTFPGKRLERLPDKPLRIRFIDESLTTPPGQPNAGAAWLNNQFLPQALANRLQKTSARETWETHANFPSWALWAYLSPDSRFHGDERWIPMLQTWFDTLFGRLQERPADPKAAEKWKPDRLRGFWNFEVYTLPLLEIEARPELAARIGTDRVARYRQMVVASIAEHTDATTFNDLRKRTERVWVNGATHEMAVFIHGWVLTGDSRYLRMARTLVQMLDDTQLPNGMFAYRVGVHGPQHVEYETMYYHAINVKALYLYWWHTGSEQAARLLRRSVPYYPLNLEPPYHFNDGADIWWKDQWRTFWPMHPAMVAAVAGDGENASIANSMARDNVSCDRIDLVLGAHAYQLMGLNQVREQPVRDRFVMRDPDIRGLRLRFAPWSGTFTTGSFTFTRASAMLIHPGNGYAALHLARPYLRVAPLETAQKCEPDYGVLPAAGAEHTAVLDDNALAVATQYRLMLTPATWSETRPEAPMVNTELWLMTDQGMVGLIASRATATVEAREFNHQFRFIPLAGQEFAESAPGIYGCGQLRFRIWDTDFPVRIIERVRRYCQSPTDRKDWQLALADEERAPEQVAQAGPAADGTKPALKLPATHTFPADYRRFSLAEVSPLASAFRDVAKNPAAELPGFTVTLADGSRLLACHNPGDRPAPLALPAGARANCSWTKRPRAVATAASLTVPPGGVVLVRWAPNP